MKHASTRAVFTYWNERRGNRPAPGRGDIDPVGIRHALGDTFMLSADFVDQLRFRLAGTRICALFCREIKGEILSDLWAEKSRKAIEDILSIVTTETAGAVTGLTGHAEDGATADLEMLLLPLARTGHARTGVLGVLAPTTPTYWIGEKPVVEIELNTVRHLGPQLDNDTAPRFAAPASSGELRHGFTVYSGGRVEPPNERAS
jgi:hypothetical protein